MSRSIDESRRSFLLRLAKVTAFVPPAVASFDVGPAAAQGKTTTGGTTTGGSGKGSSTVGSMSPTANTMEAGDFRMTPESQSPQAPWTPARPSQPPPWSRPPPTQTGR